jgi:hypothetical protein
VLQTVIKLSQELIVSISKVRITVQANDTVPDSKIPANTKPEACPVYFSLFHFTSL